MSSGNEVFDFGAVQEECTAAVKRIVGEALQGKTYEARNAKGMVDSVNRVVLEEMQRMSPNFKFIANTIICENVGGGIHVESACFWNASSDGSIVVKWENKSMICIVTMFGLAI